MKILNKKNKTSKLIKEKARRIKQTFKNKHIYRLYDLYKCTECNIETYIRRDVSHGKRICECQNIFTNNKRLYWIWYAMIQRCDEESCNTYKDYGNRGIKITDISWYDFKNFKKWALSNGYADDLTIERINNNGNYEPSNCKWETKYNQTLNKRNNRLTKDNIIKMRQLKKDGLKNKDIYELYKDKVNNRTHIDAILRSEKWNEEKW